MKITTSNVVLTVLSLDNFIQEAQRYGIIRIHLEAINHRYTAMLGGKEGYQIPRIRNYVVASAFASSHNILIKYIETGENKDLMFLKSDEGQEMQENLSALYELLLLSLKKAFKDIGSGFLELEEKK